MTPTLPKNTGRMPAFLFYPGDWRKDPAVQALGVWFELLCLMHESSERGVLLLNGRPIPEDALVRLLGIDAPALARIRTILVEYGVARKREGDGALYSKRMVQDERLRQIRREAGAKGGNPALLALRSGVPAQDSSSLSSAAGPTKAQPPAAADTAVEANADNALNNADATPAKAPQDNGPPPQNKGKPLGKAPPGAAARFEEFWQAYPRKNAKADAVKAWRKVRPEEVESILAAVARQAQSADWQRHGGRFIPHLASWLNARRWEDEAPPPGGSAATTAAARPLSDRQNTLASWFFRPRDTPWSAEEWQAWEAVPQPVPATSWQALQRYYEESGSPYLKRSLIALLKDWNQEIDRANTSL